MVTVENVLRKATRRIAHMRGGCRVIEPIRRHYVKRHVHRQDGPILVHDFDGDLKLRVDRTSYMGSLIYWRGYHSMRELKCLARHLRPDSVFVDVGANHGEFTTFAAKRLTSGRVLAFEPLDENYRQLCENIRMNGFANVTTFPCGLSDTAREVELFSSNDERVHGSWHEGLATVFPTDYRSASLGKVRLETLDEVFEKSGLSRVDGIKIDVEGSELPVLKGACRTIERYRPFLILEVNEEMFNAAGYSTREVFDLLRPMGYTAYRIARDGQHVSVDGDTLPPLCNAIWTCTAVN